MTKKLLNTLIELEKSLHTTTIKSSKEKLNDLLHDEFEEIGTSGKIYNKSQIIEALTTETHSKIQASDFELRMLSKDIAKLKYKTSSSLGNGIARTTLRTSIWKQEQDRWKMIFHQGTAISASV
jgi:hypothetical protein